MKKLKFDTGKFKIDQQQKVSLKDYEPNFCDGFESKKEANVQLKEDIELMSKLQYQLYAENKRSLLIIFQAMDAAGKDGAIKHVFSGVNPQGCSVYSFKQPSTNELNHDFLWRHYNKVPERGKIGIFNRSHYENVLISQVHPEIVLNENIPGIDSTDDISKEFWQNRYQQIINFEQTLFENGTTVIKFFLHLSKKEQKKRFLERIDNPEKNWKFSSADIHERNYWEDYQKAYEKAIGHTATKHTPWYIIPADNKWFSRVAIGNIIVETLMKMKIAMPEIEEKEKLALVQAKQKLIEEYP